MTTMDDYVTLGRSGLRVSPLTLGAMTFGEDWGWGADAATSHRLLETYLDAGGNSIDTANAYTNGHSEAMLGDWLTGHSSRRDRLVLGTKFFCNLHAGDPNGGGAGRKSILDQLEQSLRRLQTDYVDIYWLHQWDRTTPIEETLRTLDDIVRAGKVRYLGFSDLPTWVASKAQTIADLRTLTPAVGFQLEYSLLERTVEQEYLPMCSALGMGVMSWSPLRNGLLSGKYRRGQDEPEGPARGSILGGPDEHEWDTIEAVATLAEEMGAPPAAVAHAWVVGNPSIASMIIGARTAEQLASNLAVPELVLTTEQRDRLDAVSTPVLNFPDSHTPLLGDLQYAGATVDGLDTEVNWQLRTDPTRY